MTVDFHWLSEKKLEASIPVFRVGCAGSVGGGVWAVERRVGSASSVERLRV